MKLFLLICGLILTTVADTVAKYYFGLDIYSQGDTVGIGYKVIVMIAGGLIIKATDY